MQSLEIKKQLMRINKVVSRSLMKRLISLSGLGLVKRGAVSRAKIRRALRNNEKKISLDSKRPQLNGGKESQNSHDINWIERRRRTFSITKGT